LNTPGQSAIRLRLTSARQVRLRNEPKSYGGTGVMSRGDRREQIYYDDVDRQSR